MTIAAKTYKNAAMKAILQTFDGEFETEVAATPEEWPAIIIFCNRGFYKVSSRENGKIGIYQECTSCRVNQINNNYENRSYFS